MVKVFIKYNENSTHTYRVNWNGCTNSHIQVKYIDAQQAKYKVKNQWDVEIMLFIYPFHIFCSSKLTVHPLKDVNLKVVYQHLKQSQCIHFSTKKKGKRSK